MHQWGTARRLWSQTVLIWPCLIPITDANTQLPENHIYFKTSAPSMVCSRTTFLWCLIGTINCWDREFEYHWGHWCKSHYFVCCVGSGHCDEANTWSDVCVCVMQKPEERWRYGLGPVWAIVPSGVGGWCWLQPLQITVLQSFKVCFSRIPEKYQSTVPDDKWIKTLLENLWKCHIQN